MASRASHKLAVFAAIVSIAAASASAQTLQRLAVRSFDLASDTSAPHVDVPFHLVVTLRVRERVAQIQNIDLPILAQLELLGDERETTQGPRGTQYRETITVLAHDSGMMTIGSATLQAIDARDGKPKQWFTNGLTIRVSAARSRALANAGRAAIADLVPIARLAGWLLLWLVGIGCAAALVLLLFRHRSTVTVPLDAAAPVVSPPRSPRAQAQDALAVLRTERTRGAALAVRAALWRMAGASEGETLGDLLRRTDPHDVTLRDLLVALERAAFTYDEDLQAAIDDACSALQRYIDA